MWTKMKNKEKRNTHDSESDPSSSKQFTELVLVLLFLLFHVPKNQNPTTQNEPETPKPSIYIKTQLKNFINEEESGITNTRCKEACERNCSMKKWRIRVSERERVCAFFHFLQ